MVYNIHALPQAQTIKSATDPHASHHRAQGKIGSARVRKLPSASQMIDDLAEELSSAQSEHLESKKIESHKEEELRQDIYTHLIGEIEREYPAHDDPQKKHAEEFLQGLKERKPKNQAQVKEFLNELTEDKAEALSILHSTSGAADLTPAMRNLLEVTAQNFANENRAPIQAGINTIALSKARAPALNQEGQKLQAAYQAFVCSYEGILPTLTDLAKNKQLEKFDAMSDFLMQAAAKDLASPQTSTQPRRLLHILASFQGVKVFNTICDWSNKTYKRFQNKMTTQTNLTQQELLHSTLQYISKPESFNSEIKLPLRNLRASDRVQVFQNLRSGVRGLPNYLFSAGEADKARVLFPLQNEIDKLVYEQDA